MTSRDLVVATLNHEPAGRAPRDLQYAAAVETSRAHDVAEIEIRYPRDIAPAEFTYPAGKRSKGKPLRVGQYTDAWGCTWEVAQRGATGEVVHSPLANGNKISGYTPPLELIDGAKLAQTNRQCATTSRFVLARTQIFPFNRLEHLRGVEVARSDLASGTKRIRKLLDMLHDYFCREAEMWANSDVDGVLLHDNWGSADALLVAPEIWRKLFRPLYDEYCSILHAKDKFAFFRSDGKISDIFSDLVKIGVDAVHSQLYAMNVDRLAKRFRGRVTFCGEIDCQLLRPSGTHDDIRDAVRRIRRALDFGRGGLISYCRWEPEVSLRNVAHLFEQWMLPLPLHAT